jgi:hypothetical protein
MDVCWHLSVWKRKKKKATLKYYSDASRTEYHYSAHIETKQESKRECDIWYIHVKREAYWMVTEKKEKLFLLISYRAVVLPLLLTSYFLLLLLLLSFFSNLVRITKHNNIYSQLIITSNDSYVLWSILNSKKNLRGNIPRCYAPIYFVHTSFDRGHRADKKSKRICAEGFSFGGYDRFTEFWVCDKGFPKKSKSRILTWNFVHREVY